MNEKAGKIISDARNKKGWTQAETAEKLAGMLNQTYSSRQYQRLEEGVFPKYKKGIVTGIDKLLGTNTYDIIYEENIPTGNTLNEDQASYIEKRRQHKNAPTSSQIPAYVGNTKMGKFEAYADDPDMQSPAGYFDSQIFPGCNHAEKVSGDSMYPLIVNQGWIIGKVIDKSGIISGEKYCLHLRSGQNIVKYVQWENKKKDVVKIISHNKKIPEDTVPINDIIFCVRVYFIINPS